MASKKQRKQKKQLSRQQKQQRKQQQTYREKQQKQRVDKLTRQGLTEDQARKLQQYNREQQERLKKQLQEQQKKEQQLQKRRDRDRKREQRNLQELLAAGFTEEEAKKLRRKSQKDIAALAKQKRDEATAAGDYMLVFVRDKTGGRVDAITGEGTGEWSEAVYWQKQMAKGLGIKSLLSGINSALEGMDSVGNIGEAVIDVVPASHIDQTIAFRARQEFFLVYRGQGRSYKSLVSLINNVMSFLYLRSQRDVFIRDLHANLYNLGNAAARRNADRIEKEFL